MSYETGKDVQKLFDIIQNHEDRIREIENLIKIITPQLIEKKIVNIPQPQDDKPK